MDIVLEEDKQQTGFLATNVDEYADAILKILRMPETERLKMAAAARRRAERFSEHKFYEDFKAAIRPVFSSVSRWHCKWVIAPNTVIDLYTEFFWRV